MILKKSAGDGVSVRDLHFLHTLGSRSRGVNLENVVVPLRAQPPSPAAFDGEQHAGASPGRALLGMGHSQFKSQPLWI